MKNNKIIILLLLLLVLLFLGSFVFKKNTDVNKKEHYFSKIQIKNNKTIQIPSINYKEKYSNYIINDNLLSVDYDFYDDEKSITGKIYIGNDKKLYITDVNLNKVHKISDIKFKTMYIKDYFYEDKLFVFLISEDNNMYNILLTSNVISEARLFKYELDYKFVNFVDIEINHDIYDLAIPVFALTSDNKIIDINSGLPYDEDVIALYNNLYVYPDKTITDMYGKILEDKNERSYKIKYIFNILNGNELIKDENQFIIVTEDYRLIYCNIEMTELYEFDKKVKEVKFDEYYPYLNSKLEIMFEDNYKVEFTAQCNQYYCINEFAE